MIGSKFSNLLILEFLFSPAPKRDTATSTQLYTVTSFCYVAAMWTSNAALLYVSYPTQVLAKSCKMIPVMIFGILIAKKNYSLSKYVNMILITASITIFSLDGMSHKSKNVEHENQMLGNILLVLSLFFDGITNGLQDKMNQDKHKKPTSDELMYYMNSWATIYLGIALVIQGEIFPAYKFFMEYKEAFVDVILLAASMCAGQFFIFWCISDFGNLVSTLLTTTRKFFTIILSVIWYGHKITPIQWGSVSIVFFSLLFDSYMSYVEHRKKDKENLSKKI